MQSVQLPSVVYHGTNRDFDSFDLNRIGENTGNDGHYGYGFYFSDSEREAATYGVFVKKYQINISNPFTSTDEQYLQLQRLGWNVGDYGNQSLNFASVIEALENPELKFFAQCLQNHGSEAWDAFRSRYPESRNDQLNEVYDLYCESDASGHDTGANKYAIDICLEVLGLQPHDVKYNQGFIYKTPLHYITNTGACGKQLTNDLKDLGYDGVIYGSEFVIFDADQAVRVN
jgi:hypothetical protein